MCIGRDWKGCCFIYDSLMIGKSPGGQDPNSSGAPKKLKCIHGAKVLLPLVFVFSPEFILLTPQLT